MKNDPVIEITKKPIITLVGMIGSGKSSAGKAIAQMLDFQHLSSGDRFREEARRRKITTEQLSIQAENDPTIDANIDDWVKSLGNQKNLIIDSRLAAHWHPEAFNVFLVCDFATAAERAFKDLEKNESRRLSEKVASIEEMEASIISRYASDCRRFKDLYGIDYADPKGYDVIIDTANWKHDIFYVIDTVCAKYEIWLNDKPSISSKSLKVVSKENV